MRLLQEGVTSLCTCVRDSRLSTLVSLARPPYRHLLRAVGGSACIPALSQHVHNNRFQAAPCHLEALPVVLAVDSLGSRTSLETLF
jgi:hypothetical protein